MSRLILPDSSGGPGPDDDLPAHEDRAFLRRTLEEMIARNRGVVRATESQRLMDRLAEACLAEGDLELGMAVALLHSLRVAEQAGAALACLGELVGFLSAAGALRSTCRACGCTDEAACEGGCHWVEFDLCSRCAAGGKAVTP